MLVSSNAVLRTWNRHPYYVCFFSLLILIVIYRHIPYAPIPTETLYHLHDLELPAKLERSERIYQKMLKDRKLMIRKWGPNPRDVVLFPPNKAPWPAYTVWDFFPPAYNCPHQLDRLGSMADGGKWVCGITRLMEKPDCIVYSFGVNFESSFEAAVLSHTDHCQVWGYDFSVKSFGPEIPAARAYRAHFKPYGLGGEDKHERHDDPPYYTLRTLMELNGHKYIDILKIDIEGSEFDTLGILIQSYLASGEPLPFAQLQVEIHLWDKNFEQFLKWWETLEEAGLRPFWAEPNLIYQIYNEKTTPDLSEYSFLNIRGDNVFIRDPPSQSNSHPDETERRNHHHPHAPLPSGET